MKRVYCFLSDKYKIAAKYIFSALIILCPIFTIYSSPIPKVGLFEFFLILFCVLTLIFDFKKYKLALEILPFFISMYLCLMVVVWINPKHIIDNVGTALRLLFYYGILMIYAREYFSYKFALKLLVVVSIILSIYGLVQLALGNLFSIFLYNYIPFLPEFSGTAGNTYAQILDQAHWGITTRAYSIFREPAHFATYVLVPAVLLLFKRKKTVFSIITGLFFVFTSIATLSSTGILLSGMILVAFFVISIIKKEIKWWGILIVGVSVVAGGVLFFILGGWNFFIEKTFGSVFDLLNIFNDSRLTIIPLLMESSILKFVFGRGLYYPGFYMATFVSAFYGLGIVGIIGLIHHLVLLFWNQKNRSNVALMIVYTVINIGTEVALGAFAMPFLAFALSYKEESITFFKKITL